MKIEFLKMKSILKKDELCLEKADKENKYFNKNQTIEYFIAIN